MSVESGTQNLQHCQNPPSDLRSTIWKKYWLISMATLAPKQKHTIQHTYSRIGSPQNNLLWYIFSLFELFLFPLPALSCYRFVQLLVYQDNLQRKHITGKSSVWMIMALFIESTSLHKLPFSSYFEPYSSIKSKSCSS